jgi:hypothetical protein
LFIGIRICFVKLPWSGVSRDSSIGIALGYVLEDRSSRVRLPAVAGNFSLHRRVQNGSGIHPASYPMGTRSSFPGGKAARAWSWPLTSTSCRGQRMSGAIHPFPNTPSGRGAQLKHKDNCTFTLIRPKTILSPSYSSFLPPSPSITHVEFWENVLICL